MDGDYVDNEEDDVGRRGDAPINLVDTDEEDADEESEEDDRDDDAADAAGANAEDAPTETLDLDFISDEAAETTQRKKYDNDLFWDIIEPVPGVIDYAYVRFEHTRRKNYPSYAAAALFISNKQAEWRLHPKFHIRPNEESKEHYIRNKKVQYNVTRSNGDAVTQRLFAVRMKNFSTFTDEQVTKCGELIVKFLKENPKFFSKSIGQEGDFIRRGLSHCDLVGEFEALQACKANHEAELNATWGRRNPNKLKAYFKKGQLPSAYAHELGAPREWIKESDRNQQRGAAGARRDNANNN